MLTLLSIYGLTERNRSWKFHLLAHQHPTSESNDSGEMCSGVLQPHIYHELNPALDLYLFVLHYVILPMINWSCHV